MRPSSMPINQSSTSANQKQSVDSICVKAFRSYNMSGSHPHYQSDVVHAGSSSEVVKAGPSTEVLHAGPSVRKIPSTAVVSSKEAQSDAGAPRRARVSASLEVPQYGPRPRRQSTPEQPANPLPPHGPVGGGQYSLAGPGDTPQVRAAHEVYVDPEYRRLNPDYDQPANGGEPLWSMSKPLPHVVRTPMLLAGEGDEAEEEEEEEEETDQDQQDLALPTQQPRQDGAEINPRDLEAGRVILSKKDGKRPVRAENTQRHHGQNSYYTHQNEQLARHIARSRSSSRFSRSSRSGHRLQMSEEVLPEHLQHDWLGDLTLVSDEQFELQQLISAVNRIADDNESRLPSVSEHPDSEPQNEGHPPSESDHSEAGSHPVPRSDRSAEGPQLAPRSDSSRNERHPAPGNEQLGPSFHGRQPGGRARGMQSSVKTPSSDGRHLNRTVWSRWRARYKEGLAELLGVVIQLTLGFTVDLCVAFATTSYTNTSDFGWGLATMIGIYVSGGISGAHLNPTITLVFWFFRGLDKNIRWYFSAQFLGAFIAGMISYGVCLASIQEYKKNHTSHQAIIDSLVTSQRFHYIKPINAFFNEFTGTAILVIAVLALLDDKNAPPTPGMSALIIGFLIVVLAMAFGRQTGVALNPSRDFGPRLWLFAMGYGKDLFTNPYWFYGPWAGSLCGGFTGGLIYDVFCFKGSESPVNYTWTEWKGVAQRTRNRVGKLLHLNVHPATKLRVPAVTPNTPVIVARAVAAQSAAKQGVASQATAALATGALSAAVLSTGR